jgi:plasmid rolling circle replication initiator protein Rep
MNIKVLVIDKVSETFDTKKGSKTLHMLVCQDQTRPPLRNSFDYELTAEELAKYGASVVDKPVELNVRDMSQGFSGRIRMSGAIVRVGA